MTTNESELERAHEVAIAAVGILAFLSGADHRIRGDKRQGWGWRRLGLGLSGPPEGIFAALYESALRSALSGEDDNSVYLAASRGGLRAAEDPAARFTLAGALFEREESPDDGSARLFAIETFGLAASGFGNRMQNFGAADKIAPSLDTTFWARVFVAMCDELNGGRAMYGDTILFGPPGTMDLHIREKVAQKSHQAAGEVFRPYAEEATGRKFTTSIPRSKAQVWLMDNSGYLILGSVLMVILVIVGSILIS